MFTNIISEKFEWKNICVFCGWRWITENFFLLSKNESQTQVEWNEQQTKKILGIIFVTKRCLNESH